MSQFCCTASFIRTSPRNFFEISMPVLPICCARTTQWGIEMEHVAFIGLDFIAWAKRGDNNKSASNLFCDKSINYPIGK